MILAIETSSTLCSIAFWESNRILVEYESDTPMQHATLIGQFVEKGLKKTGRIPDLVTVAIGPGSFTGLRIGLSFAQGFCFGRKIPIVGVSNHQVLAIQKTTSNKPIYSIIDARRNEVYLAKHKTGKIAEIESHQIVSIEELSEKIPGPAKLICEQSIVIPENSITRFKDKGIEIIPDRKYSAALIAQIGQNIFKKKGADDIETLEPLYIRPFAGVQ